MVKKKKNEITIRSSAAEYLTFVASTGENQDNFEIRYEDENIWLTQKMMAEKYLITAADGKHWAVHRHTAAELIVERADAEKETI